MYVNAFSTCLPAYADTHHVVAWFVGYVYDLPSSQHRVLELGEICHCAETKLQDAATASLLYIKNHTDKDSAGT
jgi:hypothetical protein